MTLFALDSTHPQDIAGGLPLAPGELVDLSPEQQAHPDNQRLIDSGMLVKQRKDKAATSDAEPAKATKQKGSDQ